MRIRNLLMLAAGAGAMLGLASCGGREIESEVKQNVDHSKIYKELDSLKRTSRLQTNPLEKQGGSYYV